MEVFDDGAGPGLFVAGSVSWPSNESLLRVWRNGAWSNVASAPNSINGVSALSLFVHHDSATPTGSLWMGGTFSLVEGQGSVRVARYSNPCACDATTYCTSGVTSSGCVPTIAGVGRATATNTTPFTIELSDLEGARTGHIFYGLNGPHASPWGQSSHFLCVKAPSQRTPTQPTGGVSGTCTGAMTLDWTSFVASHPAALGVPFQSGDDIWAQAYFRDPAGAKTTALSNGLHFVICP